MQDVILTILLHQVGEEYTINQAAIGVPNGGHMHALAAKQQLDTPMNSVQQFGLMSYFQGLNGAGNGFLKDVEMMASNGKENASHRELNGNTKKDMENGFLKKDEEDEEETSHLQNTCTYMYLDLAITSAQHTEEFRHIWFFHIANEFNCLASIVIVRM